MNPEIYESFPRPRGFANKPEQPTFPVRVENCVGMWRKRKKKGWGLFT